MTKTAIDAERLTLRSYDFLGIDYDVAKSEFIMRCRALTTDEREAAPNSPRYTVRGVVAYDAWTPPSYGAQDTFPRLAECEWSAKKQRYRVAATDFNAVMIDRMWPRDRLLFASRAAERRFLGLLSAWSSGSDVAETIAKFKLDGTMPELGDDWRERRDTPLSDYQRIAAHVALGREGFAYFMDRGTGKTATAIQKVCAEAIAIDKGDLEGGGIKPNGGKMMRVLVVCPQQVRLNWQREFAKFATVAGKVSVLRGGLPMRVKSLAQMVRADDDVMFSVTIASYDSVSNTVDHLCLVPWDLVICDESHYYKSQATNRFKALSEIREISGRRLGLTGTPIGNSVMDLWSQLEFLRKGSSGFSHFKAFKQFHGEYVKSDNGAVGVAKLVGLKNIPLLQERLSRMSFSVTKDEAGLNLPDKVYSVEEVQMTKYQAEVYAKIRDEMALEIEDKLSGDVVDEVTVSNILTRLLRLAQITSGFITYDAVVDMDTGEVVRPKRVAQLSPQNPKVDMVMERLRAQDPKAKTIVWTYSVENIRRLEEELKKAGIKYVTYYGGTKMSERDGYVDAFNNDPETKVMVANPQTAGEGLNLLGYNVDDPDNSDTYCDLEIFFSNNWSSIQRGQAEDRAHRRGTRMPVQVVDLVVPGTIDEEILDRLQSKKELGDTVLELKKTLHKVLGRVL